jgi:peptidoglycan/LPS O-acetylase OafA/YrhL
MSADRGKFAFLDGIRGYAALYVAIFHGLSILPLENLTPLAQLLRGVSVYGSYAVAVFITLSGFVLALPYVQNGMAGWSLSRFVQRRARRILPPYYIATLLSLPWAMAFHRLHHEPMLYPQMLLGLFPLQYLDGSGRANINAPHWTVGVEFLIYLLYALIYFPLWRRFGIYALLGSALVLSFAPLLLGEALTLRWYYQWYYPSYFGLFALGAFTAWLCGDPARTERRKQLWVLVFPLVALLVIGRQAVGMKGMIVADYTASLLTCLLILAISFGRGQRVGEGLRAFFSNRFALFAGKISYSLYLIHYPLISTSAYVFKKFLGMDGMYSAQLIFAVGGNLGLGYVFHRFFEKPFLNKPEVNKK